MTLPHDFVPLSFNAARGLPQSVALIAGKRQLQVTLIASVTDLPALRSVPITKVLFDGDSIAFTKPIELSMDKRHSMRGTPPDTLAAQVVKPAVLLREGTSLLGARPVIAGRRIRMGTNAASPLVLELLFDRIVITAGSLIQPGDFGASIVAGARLLANGLARNESSVPEKEEDLYGALA